MRRRWASGIAVVAAVDAGGGLRGVTVSSLMIVSQEPPVLAVALTAGSSFQELAVAGATLGVSVLDATHEFAAERFAGRAPLPDAHFTGVAHGLVEGIPVLDGALAWCRGRVLQRDAIGDHVLVLLEVTAGDLGSDTDDPLLSYEGRYRRLEAS
jgi:flavin reductase (DIM6/NTAB) family NADH-FMN oxidoreductase RutF